ncbi:MAG: DUF433 domain-containing protein [Dehalococcoidia bacterium]|nr:DUF433 domain-containing protein [Dehalococcoidia bacterium]
MTGQPVDIDSFIVRAPDVRGGAPCIRGTGMTVRAIGARFRRGDTAATIAADLPDIPESHIYAAVAYYLANRAAFDAEIDAMQADGERLYQEWLKDRHRLTA